MGHDLLLSIYCDIRPARLILQSSGSGHVQFRQVLEAAEEYTASFSGSEMWRQRLHVPSKQWYQPTRVSQPRWWQ